MQIRVFTIKRNTNPRPAILNIQNEVFQTKKQKSVCPESNIQATFSFSFVMI